MRQASDGSSLPWFMARSATSLLRPVKQAAAGPTPTCRAQPRRVKPAPWSRQVLLGPYCPPLRFRSGTAEIGLT
jgi:hypothetical protein